MTWRRRRVRIPCRNRCSPATDVSRDGRVLLAVENLRVAMRGLLSNSPKEQDLSWYAGTSPRAISADGKLILFDESSEPAGPNYAVGIRRADGGPPVRLGERWTSGFSSDYKWATAIRPDKDDRVQLLPTGRVNQGKSSRKGWNTLWTPLSCPTDAGWW